MNTTIPADLGRRLVYLSDPFNFIKHCVYTRDEVDKNQPVKRAPVTPDHPQYKWYVEPVIKIIDNCGPIICLDKSRRMWISYAVLSYLLHYAMTHNDQRIGIVTEKFEKSCAHLENMRVIFDNIPEEIYPAVCRPKLRWKEGLIAFDEIGSYIHAVASGPDQARQYGFSRLFFDEMDFWADQDLTFAAARPTISGGGKIIIASTHKRIDTGVRSFYRKIVEDQISYD